MNNFDDRPRRGPPKRISDLLSTLLARKGYAQGQAVEECQDAWREIVGSRFANSSQPANLRRGVLEIVVSNSTVLQELTFRKRELLERMGEQLPEQRITALRLRVGVIESKSS